MDLLQSCFATYYFSGSVSVIRTYGMKIKWHIFVLYLYYVCSYKLITHNKRFNIRANICQRKSEFHPQILIL